MSEVLYETDNYIVRSAEGQVISEDGTYRDTEGYEVINRATKQVECTSMIFPQAIYQAQGFSDSVAALTKDEIEDSEGDSNVLSLVDAAEDVVPH